jgi:hypothetical protein
LDVHNSFSPASKAQEAPKLPQKEIKKQTRRKAFCLPLLLSFVDWVSLLLWLLVLLSSTTGVWSFFALFQQPSGRV